MEEDFDIRQEQGRKGEKDFENALRPLRFGDFSGQQKVVENLEVFVEAAKYRGEPLDHTLLHGPPGLGKTTLSNIIANELGVGFKITSGPVLDKPGDLAGILTSLEPREVLFIDEIHRLSPVVEEYLYSAMEDYRIDIMIDKGPSARSIQIDLNPFTLVGATTRSGLLTAPLRARFGINLHLEYYGPEMLQKIIKRSAMILKVPIDDDAAIEIARRSRGTPRIANALLRRVRDFAQVKGNGRIDRDIARLSLSALNIDQYGLDEIDNKILLTIIDKFRGGPVGVSTIATAIGEDTGTVVRAVSHHGGLHKAHAARTYGDAPRLPAPRTTDDWQQRCGAGTVRLTLNWNGILFAKTIFARFDRSYLAKNQKQNP